MLQHGRFVRLRGQVALALSLAVLLYTSLLPGTLSAQTAAEPRAAGYEGRTLYQGIFLGHGPVADAIPEVRDHMKLEYFITDAGTRQELLAYYDEILDGIEKIAPGYFQDFAAVVQSGDHVAIDAELQRAAELTLEAVERTAEYQAAIARLNADPSLMNEVVDKFNAQVPATQQLSHDDVDEVVNRLSGEQAADAFALVWICATFVVAVVWVVAAVDVAVVSNVAAAIAIYLAIGVEKYVAGPSKRAVEVGDVLHEQMVNSIATKLAV